MFPGFFVCKLKKLSNDKKRPGGDAEGEEDADEGEEGGEEEGAAPAWAEDGGAAKARAKGPASAKKPSEVTVVPVSRPKSNPKAVPAGKAAVAAAARGGKNQASASVAAGGKVTGALPRDFGNPGPGDILGAGDDEDKPARKTKAEPSIVRAAKRVNN